MPSMPHTFAKRARSSTRWGTPWRVRCSLIAIPACPPPITSGHPNELWSSIQPANSGGTAAARLRGTWVTLAAAARSAGVTTAIT